MSGTGQEHARHTPIPVAVAHHIATKFRKSMVVILAYDPASQLTHTTTYGVEPSEKERAAEVGERCAKMICGDGFDARTSYKDYRFTDQGKRARQIEMLSEACRRARLALRSIRSVRDGLTDEGIDDVVAVIDLAIANGTKVKP